MRPGGQPMKVVYLTDPHGNHSSFKRALAIARQVSAQAIIHGGDLLPKRPFTAENQGAFLMTWYKNHLEKARELGIRVFSMFGNDDLRVFLPGLKELTELGLCERLDVDGWKDLGCGAWNVIGVPWVPDYPFRLKDWTLRDDEGWAHPLQLGLPVVSGFVGCIPSIVDAEESTEELHAKRPTMARVFAELPASPNPRRSILVAHCPPAGYGLDICAGGQAVGSGALRRHLESEPPAISLHGHIHESRLVTGLWRFVSEHTTSINPGDDAVVVLTLGEDGTHEEDLVELAVRGA